MKNSIKLIYLKYIAKLSENKIIRYMAFNINNRSDIDKAGSEKDKILYNFTNNIAILFRRSLAEENEFEIGSKYFKIVESRVGIRNKLVMARYSALPFYKELEEDLKIQGSSLINTYEQHCYLASVSSWYEDLKGITPETWNNFIDIPSETNGPFVLKGETNSRKTLWKTHMFAKDLNAARIVLNNLLDDTLIGNQGIIIRKYEELVSYGKDLTGMPISKEFRFFILDGQVISGGFYWSQHIDEIGYTPDASEVPLSFLQSVIERIGNQARFYAVDVAQRASDGSWIVIELNDGQQSGLSCNDPKALYSGLKRVLDG